MRFFFHFQSLSRLKTEVMFKLIVSREREGERELDKESTLKLDEKEKRNMPSPYGHFKKRG